MTILTEENAALLWKWEIYSGHYIEYVYICEFTTSKSIKCGIQRMFHICKQ